MLIFLFLIRFKIGRAHFVPCAISWGVNDIKIEKISKPAKIHPLVYIDSWIYFLNSCIKQIVVSMQVLKIFVLLHTKNKIVNKIVKNSIAYLEISIKSSLLVRLLIIDIIKFFW